MVFADKPEAWIPIEAESSVKLNANQYSWLFDDSVLSIFRFYSVKYWTFVVHTFFMYNIVWLLAGIDCPRGKRQLPNGQSIESDPYGEEALMFTKEMCLQREVSGRCFDD